MKDSQLSEVCDRLRQDPGYFDISRWGRWALQRNKRRNEAIFGLWREGWSQRQIAELCRMSSQRVHQIIRKMKQSQQN